MLFKIKSYLLQGGNRRPALPHKPLSPPLDASFHRDKNFSTTENVQYDLKPESETPQESSTKKKDASHQATHTDDHEIKDHTGSSVDDRDRIELTATVDESGLQNVTKKPEPEESTKKNQKHHPPSKENNVNTEETLILGIATGDVTPTRTTQYPAASKTTTSPSSQSKVTKSSKNEDKAPATTKAEKPTEKTVSAVSKTATKIFSTSTLNIETSSSVEVIESTPTRMQPTIVATESNADSKSSVVNLEPSRVLDIEYTASSTSVSTPTEGLPAGYSKSSSMIEKTTVHPTIFTKNTGKPRYTDRQAEDVSPDVHGNIACAYLINASNVHDV